MYEVFYKTIRLSGRVGALSLLYHSQSHQLNSALTLVTQQLPVIDIAMNRELSESDGMSFVRGGDGIEFDTNGIIKHKFGAADKEGSCVIS